MAFLSDHTIKGCVQVGRIKIEPYDEANVQPASYDMHLDNKFKTIAQSADIIDPREPVAYDEHEVGSYFVLGPLRFVLASTIERIELAPDIVGRLEGKSSLGRLGLTAHITAGFFDPGFSGHATLELFNATNAAIVLWPGMPICQMSFARLTSRAARPYGDPRLGSKYMNQPRGPQGSEMHRNFT